MGAKVDVICGFDDEYAPQLSSLFSSSKSPGKIQLHLISNFLAPPIRQRLEAIVDRSKIVHFNDGAKPWQFAFKHPYRQAYFDHLAKSGWPHVIRKGTLNGLRDQLVKFE
jgi:lipopolysaccharide biosynthesis glycosyltransferase